MTYLFHRLEKLCNALLYSTSCNDANNSIPNQIREETEKIIKELKDIYFKEYTPECFEKFVDLHLNTLTDMMDDLSRHIDIGRTKLSLSSAAPGNLEPLFAADYYMNILLNFIHDHYSRFISTHRRIPKRVLSVYLKEVRASKATIEELMDASVDKALPPLIIKPFHDFLQGRQQATHHYLHYCRTISEKLQKLSAEGLTTDNLIWMMYSINYNSQQFYNFITWYIPKMQPDNYLQTLRDIKHRVHQTFISSLVFNPENPPLNKMLDNWIKEEIRYIKKSSQLKLPLSKQDQKQPEHLPQKIMTRLSVAELACLLKVMIDTNLLYVTNHRDLFRCVSLTWRTRSTDNISSESLRSKFYTPEPNTHSAVKGHLIEIIGRLNTQFPQR